MAGVCAQGEPAFQNPKTQGLAMYLWVFYSLF